MSHSTTGTEPGFAIDHGAHIIRFEREVNAPREEVFEAWTTPEEVTAWWDPDGEPLVTCEIDLRVGGAFAFATRAHSEMPFAGSTRNWFLPSASCSRRLLLRVE